MHAMKPVLRDQGSSDVVHSARATLIHVHVRHRYSARVYLGVYAHAYVRLLRRQSLGGMLMHAVAAAYSNSDSPMRASGRALVQ